jgi:hypothetical protein
LAIRLMESSFVEEGMSPPSGIKILSPDIGE